MITLDEKYKNGFLKEYTHWYLVISFRQHTPGSFIILAKREFERFSEINSEEYSELMVVMKEMEGALAKTFAPDRYNYLQLGNKDHNLHFHGVPRYASPRSFDGKELIDVNFGRPVVWVGIESHPEYILKVRDHILPHV
jgi:diadenosine tetraphosphate (Ap4A) HIT family hydrolase